MRIPEQQTGVPSSPLLQLAIDLQLPQETLAFVRDSGCTTLAEWKYSFMTEPEDPHQARLWNHVQNASGTEVGAVVELTLHALRKRRDAMPRQQPRSVVPARSTRRRAPKRPFSGVRNLWEPQGLVM